MCYPIAVEIGTEAAAYGVVVPDLPGCFSAGDTLDEAVTAAEEAATAWSTPRSTLAARFLHLHRSRRCVRVRSTPGGHWALSQWTRPRSTVPWSEASGRCNGMRRHPSRSRALREIFEHGNQQCYAGRGAAGDGNDPQGSARPGRVPASCIARPQ
jgi:hypothetical protein